MEYMEKNDIGTCNKCGKEGTLNILGECQECEEEYNRGFEEWDWTG